jgi:sulfatase maturation enzyme AslB (radical SAM superfamily)
MYISVVFVHQPQTLHRINTMKNSCSWDIHKTKSQISSTSKWKNLDFNFQLEFLINNCNFKCNWCFIQQENNRVLQHTTVPDNSSVWPKYVYYQCKQVNVVWHQGEINHTVVRTLHKRCTNTIEV